MPCYRLSIMKPILACALCLFATASYADDGAGVKSDAPPSATSAKAVKQKPYAEEAVKHYNRAVELQQSGFLSQSVGEYRAAIEADPRMEEAYSNLAGVYAAMTNYSKSIEAFEKALAWKPDRPMTLNGYAMVLYASGRKEEALQCWRKAIDADPSFLAASYNLANALRAARRVDEAVEIEKKGGQELKDFAPVGDFIGPDGKVRKPAS